MRLVIAISIIAMALSAQGQPPVDYAHRSIGRLLKKQWNEQARLDTILVKTGNGRYYRALNTQNKLLGYVYIGRVFSCRSGGCQQTGAGNGNYEYFDYYVAFNALPEVKKVQVFNYQATHGHAITSRGWLRQFQDYAGDEPLRVGKEIDAISGATISSHAISEDIAARTAFFRQYAKTDRR